MFIYLFFCPILLERFDLGRNTIKHVKAGEASWAFHPSSCTSDFQYRCMSDIRDVRVSFHHCLHERERNITDHHICFLRVDSTSGAHGGNTLARLKEQFNPPSVIIQVPFTSVKNCTEVYTIKPLTEGSKAVVQLDFSQYNTSTHVVQNHGWTLCSEGVFFKNSFT